MTTAPHLLLETMDGVLRLTLNRPEKRNALTHEICRAIGDAVTKAQSDPAIQVVTLRGAGRAFSAGFDLKLEVADRSHAAKLDGLVNSANRAQWVIWKSSKPVTTRTMHALVDQNLRRKWR